MRSIHVVRLITLVAVLLSVSLPAKPQTDPDAAAFDKATAEFNRGDAAGALALVETILSHSPANQNAMYFSALINFHMAMSTQRVGGSNAWLSWQEIISLRGN
ncbi:MAG: hypothetical protein ABSE20_13495 [Acetobacteraceae bacterium]|jgi:hypothetical protein